MNFVEKFKIQHLKMLNLRRLEKTFWVIDKKTWDWRASRFCSSILATMDIKVPIICIWGKIQANSEPTDSLDWWTMKSAVLKLDLACMANREQGGNLSSCFGTWAPISFAITLSRLLNCWKSNFKSKVSENDPKLLQIVPPKLSLIGSGSVDVLQNQNSNFLLENC